MRFYVIICVSMMLCSSAFAQHRNNIWCFGDSAGVDFSNLNQPSTFKCSLKTRGSCVSIANANSDLLFYAYTRAGIFPGHTTLIKNRNHQLTVNGSNVIGEGWYMELIIIPNPIDTTLYYLFSVCVASNFGLYYSIIDMKLDSGRGAVTQKNIQLLTAPQNDGLNAIKHGNGRDWWVLCRDDGYYSGGPNNKFNECLITPAGITQMSPQYIGVSLNSSFQRLIFDKTGDKLAVVAMEGLIETYHFDRCTGLISNCTLIRQKNNTGPSPRLCSGEFSANGRFLYVSTTNNIGPSYLIQIDLQNPQPWANADTLWTLTQFSYSGLLKRGPDDKIYYATPPYISGLINYPYPDSVYNQYNMNLSVINSPDSLGAACDFQPYSFYLGGNRVYWGLPNNPDYDMPRIQGSVCDTVMWTNLTPGPSPKGEGSLTATYISEWQIAFINASGLKGKNCLLEVYDVTGKKVFEKTQQAVGDGYFTFDLNCGGFAKGMYLVSLSTEKEKLSGKFVKE